jgi:mannose/fructose/N-acetylgalactosamine-specific phosphotransferase system component IID
VAQAHVIEHGGTSASRWLRERRLKLALGLALVEGVLVIADVIPNWLAIVVGAAILGYWFVAGRHHRQQLARQVSWTAAMSQVFVALVPIAIVALVALLADRR